MGRTTIEELRNRRLVAMTTAERAQFDEAIASARLAIEVGEKVREAREAVGLSQRELAEALNARQQTISEWDRGEYAPRGTAARLLTRAAEDVQFPFDAGPSPMQDIAPDADVEESDSGRNTGDD